MASRVPDPLVSVIAVSFNHERWAIETLESIAAQTCRDFELVYCDDASSDRSAARALDWLRDRPFPVTSILHQSNRGLCRTLNEAVAVCRGRYVQMVACDDLLLPHKLASQVAALEAAPDAAVAYSRARLIDAEGHPRSPYTFDDYNRFAFPSPDGLYETLLRGNRLAAMSTLIRRSVFEEVGPYDETLPYEDWDLWLRIARGHRFVADEDFTAVYRVHGENLHLRLRDECVNYWIWRKHADHPIARENMARIVTAAIRNGTCPPAIRADYARHVRSDAGAVAEDVERLLWIIECLSAQKPGQPSPAGPGPTGRPPSSAEPVVPAAAPRDGSRGAGPSDGKPSPDATSLRDPYHGSLLKAYRQGRTPEELSRLEAAFDADFYRSRNQDVAAAGIDLLGHFMHTGWKELRDPRPDFSVRRYLDAHPELAARGVNPFLHWVLSDPRGPSAAGDGDAPARPAERPPVEAPAPAPTGPA